MKTISGQFREKEELDNVKPYDAVREKWETILSLLSDIYDISRGDTCAYCRKYKGCEGCPLQSCQEDSVWYTYMQKLDESYDAAKNMIKYIEDTHNSLTEA